MDTTGVGAAIKPMHTPDELAIGMRIRHPKLGEGEITMMGNVQENRGVYC